MSRSIELLHGANISLVKKCVADLEEEKYLLHFLLFQNLYHIFLLGKDDSSREKKKKKTRTRSMRC